MPDFGIFRGFNDKLFGDKLYAGQLPTQLGIIGSQEVNNFIGLLDIYPNAAAAYSLRKLRIAYTGSAIEVRRTNLDVADIGFDGFGNLDTAALLAFTGTGALDNGFVTKWYDQSGNGYNATQTTAANQPQIVNSGSVIIENSKPTLQFDGTNDTLSFAGTYLNTGAAHTNFALYRLRNGSNNDNVIMALKNNSNDLLYFMGGTGLTTYQDFVIGSATASWTAHRYNGIAINQFKLLTDFYNGSGTLLASNFNRYTNNTLQTSTGIVTFGGSNSTDNNIASWRNSLFTQINMSELIIYSSNQSSNVNGIDTNIINYYGL
jgi:hypothetical protein